MATISSGRWDWWNEYTEKDKVVDCLNMLSEALGRWPAHEEVTEVWPEYTLRFIQDRFGSYDTVRAEAADKVYRRNQGYRVKRSPRKLAFTGEQMLIIAEIRERSQVAEKRRTHIEPKVQITEEMRPQDMRNSIPTPQPTNYGQVQTRSAKTEPKQGARPGRKPTFSEEQLMGFLRAIVTANGGEVPTAVRAKQLLRQQKGAPSLMTMTNRLGPMSGWEQRLKNAS